MPGPGYSSDDHRLTANVAKRHTIDGNKEVLMKTPRQTLPHPPASSRGTGKEKSAALAAPAKAGKIAGRPKPAMVSKSPAAPSARGASLGLAFNSTEDIIKTVQKGLDIASFNNLCRSFAVSENELAETVRIKFRTFARRKLSGRFQSEESEKIVRVGNLFDMAVRVLGSIDEARAWFKAPKKALNYSTPLEYAGTEVGAREVENLIGRIEYGVF